MPIRTSGLVSETLKDGKWVPRSPIKSSFAINGQKMFDYDFELGTLKLNRETGPKGALEGITELIERSEGKGVSLDMTLPFESRPLHLEGIKRVSYLTPEEARVEDYVEDGRSVNLKNPSEVLASEKEIIKRKGLVQRFKNYFLKS